MRVVVASVTLLAVVTVATGSMAQTEPSVDVRDVEAQDPLVPLETTPVDVSALVSCDGWGEAGETVAIFEAVDLPDEYRTQWEDREVPVDASPGECAPGEMLNVTTTLLVEPAQDALAYASYEQALLVTLEERAGGQTVQTHGPYRGSLTLETGFLPRFTTHVDESLEGPAGAPLVTIVQVQNHANGEARVQLEASTSTEKTQALLEPERTWIAPGETARLKVTIEDERWFPMAGLEDDLRIEGTLASAVAEPDAQAADEIDETVEVSYASSTAALDQAIPFAFLLALLAAAALCVHRAHRSSKTDAATLAERAKAWRDRARGLTDALLPAGQDRVGLGLLWAGLGIVVVASAAQQTNPIIVFMALSLGVAGAVLLVRSWMPAWAGALAIGAVFGLLVLFMLEHGVLVGIRGRPLLTMQTGIGNPTPLTHGPPYLFVIAALAARTRSWGRLAALASPALIALLALGPALVPAVPNLGLVLILSPIAASLAWLTMDLREDERGQAPQPAQDPV